MAIAIILERTGNITNGSIFATVWTAKEKEDEEAAKQILAIIQRKKDKGFWSRMSYSLGKPRGGACFKVLVEQADCTVREYSGQDNIQGAIWSNIHEKLFQLAKLAPLCSGTLWGTFGV